MAENRTNEIKTIKLYLENWYKNNPKRLTFINESEYRDNLAHILTGKTEVVTPIGRIDLLCDRFMLVIELKYYSVTAIKQAIGQAICYLIYYPTYKPAIAMINNRKHTRYEELCNRFNILYFNFYDGRWYI